VPRFVPKGPWRIRSSSISVVSHVRRDDWTIGVRSRYVVVLGVGALLFAACGGGGDEDAAASVTSTSTSTTAPSVTSISSVTVVPVEQTTATTDDVRREWTNDAVTVWQEFLATTGAEIDVDGFYGRQTENATKVFQQQVGLPLTGIADQTTLAAAGLDVQQAVFDKMTVLTTTTTTERLPQPDDPVVTIACPDPETEIKTRYRATFDHTESYTEFGSILIDYGDGHHFDSNVEASGLAGAFWHVYEIPGSYDVEVTITDSDGREATATCLMVWEPS